ncbi:MAG: rhodanese-like domain-containing protein [Gammaproteobacteria bacterium]
MIRSALILLCGLLLITACENGAAPPAAGQDAVANLRDVSVSQAAELIERDENVIVLDVRSVGEFESGHIDGAMNVSFHEPDFETALSKLDKDAEYVLTCESGGRSGKTLRKLREMGFLNVAHLKRGMAGWRNADMPVAAAE